ncbi:sensor histidine kinase [Danxiaibacter flavus]|uniref:Sensor histidine kinase n=1 Tax=Danxiaibacter flavus TaxID=3049108 RepID=A0ABV3ZE05_9BACT|nr:sensor histidine kinase [Chitinophagaceae bacterium DXS]
MRKQLLWPFIGFIVFYYLLHMAVDLPNIINSRATFLWLPLSAKSLLFRLADIAANSLFTLIPYLILLYLYPQTKIVILIGLIGMAISLLFFGRYFFEANVLSKNMRLRFFFLNNLLYIFTYTAFGIVFYFMRYSHLQVLEKKELELINRQSELSFLRAQINPHFLFNSLNNIYSLVYIQSGKALDAIAVLSDLLRYMLYETNEKVSLQKELHYIEQYIALQKLRFDWPVKTEIKIAGQPESIYIAPLLLIPFVENAFKHGDFSEHADGLSISVSVTQQKIYFHCFNQKSHLQKDDTGGIGLDNVERRLALLYPGKNKLNIASNETHFIVNLEIQL